MLTDKEQKKRFKLLASQQPDQYYATQVLIREGFKRQRCDHCKKFFWNINESKVCGDAECQGKVDIFAKRLTKEALSFEQVWRRYVEHFTKRGYAVINRYPVVSRWNPTTDFTMASIAAFQPHVVSGEVEPPAKKLIIPQFCLRFGDVDNVGITGSHCTLFVMIGQHWFLPKSEWDQNQAFEDIYSFITETIGLDKTELTLHEDAWAGGGNYGACMEFFSRGVELFNQVYMQFEQTEDGEGKELSIRVLDMGLGHERVAWFTQGTPTLYDAAFPAVIAKLKQITNVQHDADLFRKFAPYASLLNIDEVEDIHKAWQNVAEHVGVPVEQLRSTIEPMTALYSIAEHSRALLVALSDGALPGNVGGYYNLRVIFRRAQGFIDKYQWPVDIADVASWHADELKTLFPELSNNLVDVQKILRIEFEKYRELMKRNTGIIDHVLKKEITAEKLVELYDSHGILPEHVQRQAKQHNKHIAVPDNFFQLVEERHAKAEQKTQTRVQNELPLNHVVPTKPLYYSGYDVKSAVAQVVFAQGNTVVLDQTIFYPTSGGQLHDTGFIAGVHNTEQIVNVYKQGNHIVHVSATPTKFKLGDNVELIIDIDRRIQLAQHHTAAHIINGAARRILGDHIWQAGAAKTLEKGRLDITHYDTLTHNQLQTIETAANDIIRQDLPVVKQEMKKAVAEAQYGFRLYQGGAVPGNTIHVIDIPGFDTEACGGTHLHTTGETELIRILRSTKIQDGVIRIEYVAGAAAKALVAADQAILRELEDLLKVPRHYVPGRIEELFQIWKKAKKGKLTAEEKKLTSTKEMQGSDAELLQQCANALSTQKEHVVKTVQRFFDDINAS